MDAASMLTTTAVVVPKLGGPDVLEVRPWAVAIPGPDDVRVAVEAAAMSFADLLVMQGVHPERRKPPFVPGWDVVGKSKRLDPLSRPSRLATVWRDCRSLVAGPDTPLCEATGLCRFPTRSMLRRLSVW